MKALNLLSVNILSEKVYFIPEQITTVSHPQEYFLCYLESGKMEIKHNRKCFSVLPGNLTILFPNDSVEVRYGHDASGLCITLTHDELFEGFEPEVYERNKKELQLLTKELFKPCREKYLYELKTLCRYSCTHKNIVDPEQLPKQISNLLNKTIVDYFERIKRVRRQRISTKLAILQTVEHVRSAIDQSCLKKFDLNWLSREASMSKFALIRSFKDVYDVTPHQYYVSKKVDYAKALLREGVSVRETAMECGYPDIFSFSKQFKMMEGFPPSYLRLAS